MKLFKMLFFNYYVWQLKNLAVQSKVDLPNILHIIDKLLSLFDYVVFFLFRFHYDDNKLNYKAYFVNEIILKLVFSV